LLAAGGAITSTFTAQPINDLDIYFRSRDAFVTMLQACYEDGYWCVACTPRAITFKDNSNKVAIQLMHFKFFASAEEIFDSFDFTACMGALDVDSGELILHPRFMADVSKRVLSFNHKTDFPLASGIRVKKYLDRGYTISGDEWLKILIACQFKPSTGWTELEEQIGGHYGEAVRLSPRDSDFTLDNVIRALESIKETDPQLRLTPLTPVDEPPATYEQAYARIATMWAKSA